MLLVNSYHKYSASHMKVKATAKRSMAYTVSNTVTNIDTNRQIHKKPLHNQNELIHFSHVTALAILGTPYLPIMLYIHLTISQI
jgi:hypothetical protein